MISNLNRVFSRKKIKKLTSHFIRGYIFYLFNKGLFKELKYPLIKYRSAFLQNKNVIEFGKNVTIAHNCFISPVSLKVGNNCWLGVNNFICGKVEIGNDVHLGPNVILPGASHIISEAPLSRSGSTFKGTIIGDYVWIGSNVTILDGVTIGKGAIISANSLVNKDVARYSIVGGVPAKFLKMRPEIKV